jgi:hypothetical protein
VQSGGWRLSDNWLPPLMIAVFPFFEWAVHTAMRRWCPKLWGSPEDRPAAGPQAPRAPRRSTRWAFVRWQALLWVLATTFAGALLLFARLGLA